MQAEGRISLLLMCLIYPFWQKVKFSLVQEAAQDLVHSSKSVAMFN